MKCGFKKYRKIWSWVVMFFDNLKEKLLKVGYWDDSNYFVMDGFSSFLGNSCKGNIKKRLYLEVEIIFRMKKKFLIWISLGLCWWFFICLVIVLYFYGSLVFCIEYLIDKVVDKLNVKVNILVFLFLILFFFLGMICWGVFMFCRLFVDIWMSVGKFNVLMLLLFLVNYLCRGWFIWF